MNIKHLRAGFIIAGIMNFSVIIFSRGFTNSAMNNADPVVMSNFGLLMVIIWGLAYIATATIDGNIKWLAGVFAIVKFIYGINWVIWILGNSLTDVYSSDLFAGLFYSVYGINDFAFMAFFIFVFISEHKKSTSSINRND